MKSALRLLLVALEHFFRLISLTRRRRCVVTGSEPQGAVVSFFVCEVGLDSRCCRPSDSILSDRPGEAIVM